MVALSCEKIKNQNVSCWLVNTGWIGGPYGVGERISIKHTRALLHAALGGKLKDVNFNEDSVFGLHIPEKCDGVPTDVLTPRNAWKNKEDYDTKAADLAKQFKDNFQEYLEYVSDDVKAAGPK